MITWLRRWLRPLRLRGLPVWAQVLAWLASSFGSPSIALDPRQPADMELIAAAQRWLDATPLQSAPPAHGAMPALPIAA